MFSSQSSGMTTRHQRLCVCVCMCVCVCVWVGGWCSVTVYSLSACTFSALLRYSVWLPCLLQWLLWEQVMVTSQKPYCRSAPSPSPLPSPLSLPSPLPSPSPSPSSQAALLTDPGYSGEGAVRLLLHLLPLSRPSSGAGVPREAGGGEHDQGSTECRP